MNQNNSIHMAVEEAVNGYRVNTFTDALGIWKENTETYLEALRVLEQRINNLIIEELQNLQTPYKEAV